MAPVHHLMVVQVDVHLALSQLQFHSFYEPRCFDTENLQVEFTISTSLMFSTGVPKGTNGTVPAFVSMVKCHLRQTPMHDGD